MLKQLKRGLNRWSKVLQHKIDTSQEQNREIERTLTLELGSFTKKQVAALLMGKKIPVGERTRTGWSGSLPFYLFLCLNPECSRTSVDYPHGWHPTRSITCQHCGSRHDFDSQWEETKMMLRQLPALLRIRGNSKNTTS